MHLRPDHTVRDLPTLHAFIRQHPLGLITTSLPSTHHPTLQSSHIPWVLDSESITQSIPASEGCKNGEPQSLGTLRGHIARQNPQTKAMVEAALDTPSKSTKPTTIPGSFPISEPDSEPASGPDQISEPRPAGYTLPGEVLVVFTSPVDHYITPNFYTESKAATGKVAPTWNYAAVQVYGRVTIYHDTKDARTEEFLRRQLGDLARLGEVGVMGFQDIDSDSNSDNSQGQESQGGEDAASGSGAGVPMTKTATATATAAEEKEKAAQELSAGNSSNTASPTPWKIADAPLEYIATLLKNIVGMQIHITRIEGRFKVSQERPVNDRSGVVEGLQGMGSVRAKAMAEFVGRGRVLG